MNYRAELPFLVGLLFFVVSVETTHGVADLDTGAVERAMGLSGQAQGEIFKISLPRTDLSVSVDGLRLKPRLALGSWVAFKAQGMTAVAHGDLVLLEKEVMPVMDRLEKEGVTFTALHNHLVRESPKVMYLHFWGEGPAEQLASLLRRALALTDTPLQQDKIVKETESSDALPAERIEVLLGHKGRIKEGVLSFSVPRQASISMNNVDLPPSMGMATAINLQAGEMGKVAAAGDFVLEAREVNLVTSALLQHGIQVTALHNHLVHASPDLYFLHFWAHDTLETVTTGIKAGLDAMKVN